MRVLFVNTTGGTCSHGKIALELARDYASQGHICRFAYGRMPSQDPYFQEIGYQIGNSLDIKIHGLATRLFDAHGFASRGATRKFLKWAEEFDPDILWLHNIHGYYLNVELLFDWIRSRPQMQVKWTLHDCWAFTGHCTNFGACGCEKWKTGCCSCPQKSEYPQSLLLDRSSFNYRKKKRIFCGAPALTIYTPSQWLKRITEESFLKEYPVEVMPNPVDRSVFRPRPSSFRQKYGLEDKIMVLGVANAWQKSKGLFDFIEVAKRLDQRYKVVLVGLTEKQKAMLPPMILGLGKTENSVELAEIYTAADIFANPSVEETFGMTAYEAALCGTPVVVYAGTACEEVAGEMGGDCIAPNAQALYQYLAGTEKKGSI